MARPRLGMRTNIIIMNESEAKDMKSITKTILLTIGLAGAMLAHGGAEHVIGTVKVIKADSLTVENAKHEMITVFLRPDTEVMKSKAKGDLKDLKVGDRVVVHAEKGKTGNLEAEEVDFGIAPAAK